MFACAAARIMIRPTFSFNAQKAIKETESCPRKELLPDFQTKQWTG